MHHTTTWQHLFTPTCTSFQEEYIDPDKQIDCTRTSNGLILAYVCRNCLEYWIRQIDCTCAGSIMHEIPPVFARQRWIMNSVENLLQFRTVWFFWDFVQCELTLRTGTCTPVHLRRVFRHVPDETEFTWSHVSPNLCIQWPSHAYLASVYLNHSQKNHVYYIFIICTKLIKLHL
jgi:hypothetical protein